MTHREYMQALYEELANAYSDWNSADTWQDLFDANQRINIFEYKLALAKGERK